MRHVILWLSWIAVSLAGTLPADSLAQQDRNWNGWGPVQQPNDRHWGGWGNDQPIICESQKFRYRECPTGTYDRVMLYRQYSDSRCVEGQSWGQRNGMVWVDRGCRGAFKRYRWNNWPNNDYSIVCASNNGQRNHCGWNSRYGAPRLIYQLSGAPCVQGRSWGYSNGRIWVDNYCRGRFGTQGGWGGSGGSGGNNYTVTCSSENGRYRNCPWDRNRGWPRLVQRLSSSPCVEGRDWGYDKYRGLWVDNGCRARFGVR